MTSEFPWPQTGIMFEPIGVTADDVALVHHLWGELLMETLVLTVDVH